MKESSKIKYKKILYRTLTIMGLLLLVVVFLRGIAIYRYDSYYNNKKIYEVDDIRVQFEIDTHSSDIIHIPGILSISRRRLPYTLNLGIHSDNFSLREVQINRLDVELPDGTTYNILNRVPRNIGFYHYYSPKGYKYDLERMGADVSFSAIREKHQIQDLIFHFEGLVFDKDGNSKKLEFSKELELDTKLVIAPGLYFFLLGAE